MVHDTGNNNGFAIGSLFDRIAGTYDRLNHLLSLNIDRRWRRRAVQEIGREVERQRGGEVLDVAIGTADLTIEILRQGKADRVIGLDVSQQMMAIGQQKVQKAGYADKVRFDYGSALEMPYQDNTFDAVTCAYGVRNFANLQQGLREMCRVLKPGGEVVILEFSYPTNPLVKACYNLYFNHLLPLIGRALSHDKTAYRYLNTSVQGFPYGQAMVKHMKQAGFQHVTFRPLSFGITTIYHAYTSLSTDTIPLVRGE